ncbi:hypothetical protein NCAS_0E03460 [Naumovozyma castellii]|uniref:Uncharacterized protein n=1 Tax=Naumovozyma castellii TaxID=27288 RepID=G0VFZ7_NAUCA|nr:hypothetical protein NCAS_0E03460 [Naumovozyma castellii CBS 4309]CCC70416.1 hypothetical protein NCAS_0E03460 [Naumovozyma castellii CBS 4309]
MDHWEHYNPYNAAFNKSTGLSGTVSPLDATLELDPLPQQHNHFEGPLHIIYNDTDTTIIRQASLSLSLSPSLSDVDMDSNSDTDSVSDADSIIATKDGIKGARIKRSHIRKYSFCVLGAAIKEQHSELPINTQQKIDLRRYHRHSFPFISTHVANYQPYTSCSSSSVSSEDEDEEDDGDDSQNYTYNSFRPTAHGATCW